MLANSIQILTDGLDLNNVSAQSGTRQTQGRRFRTNLPVPP